MFPCKFTSFPINLAKWKTTLFGCVNGALAKVTRKEQFYPALLEVIETVWQYTKHTNGPGSDSRAYLRQLKNICYHGDYPVVDL